MLELLRKFCEENTFISLYTDQTDSNAFTFCKAVFTNDEFSVVLMVHPSGSFDGIQMLHNDLILRIETDDRYLHHWHRRREEEKRRKERMAS